MLVVNPQFWTKPDIIAFLLFCISSHCKYIYIYTYIHTCIDQDHIPSYSIKFHHIPFDSAGHGTSGNPNGAQFWCLLVPLVPTTPDLWRFTTL